MKVDAWVVTLWPGENVDRALGPNDPDEEQAVLIFLTEDAALRYRNFVAPQGCSIAQVEVDLKGTVFLPEETNYAAADAAFAAVAANLAKM